MKKIEQKEAIRLRSQGYSINEISLLLKVAKSSVSLWVRDVELSAPQLRQLSMKGHSMAVVEKRRASRLANEETRRNLIVAAAKKTVPKISTTQLWLIGVMLYWAEGGKTRRTVRFSNGDPNLIGIMMAFFRIVCRVPEEKFRGYIHIHPHLDYKKAEMYWSDTSGIPLKQFFKTYRKPNKSSQSKKDSLPFGTFDIYVLDTRLFYKITGWAAGIFAKY